MDSTTKIDFAKLEALLKRMQPYLEGRGKYFNPVIIHEHFDAFSNLRDRIMDSLPEVYSDFPIREKPESSNTTDFDGKGYVTRSQVETIIADIKQMLELRSLVFEGKDQVFLEDKIFISHGRSTDWREVQAYIEKDLDKTTIELAQQANKGRTVLQKLDDESTNCSFAVIVMTGDDFVQDEAPRARENVIHEIGFFQGKYGLERICLLYEEGTNIPSNIHGLVYIPYPKDMVKATFGDLSREINAAFSN